MPAKIGRVSRRKKLTRHKGSRYVPIKNLNSQEATSRSCFQDTCASMGLNALPGACAISSKSDTPEDCPVTNESAINVACASSTANVPRLSSLIVKLENHLKSCRRKIVIVDDKALPTKQREQPTVSSRSVLRGHPANARLCDIYEHKDPNSQVAHLEGSLKPSSGIQHMVNLWNTMQCCEIEKELQGPADNYNNVL